MFTPEEPNFVCNSLQQGQALKKLQKERDYSKLGSLAVNIIGSHPYLGKYLANL